MIKLNELINFSNFSYNWEKIEEIHQFAKLKECKQSPEWHAEGDAWVHTKAVCEEASKMCQNGFKYPKVLLTAALFHDIGKGETTFEKDGKWHSYGHDIVGEKITRYLLWDYGYMFREIICALVRWHMAPLTIFDENHYLEKLCSITHDVNYFSDSLCALKECDIRGSIRLNNEGFEDDLERIYECRRLMHILSDVPEKNHLFPSPENSINVYVMIGLPGVGKTTYAQKHFNDCVIISRDIIRAELGLCKEGEKIAGTKEEEELVTAKEYEKILNAIKDGKSICIDNLNITKKSRERYKALLKDYPIEWNYIYLELPSLEKNKEIRKGQIKEDAFYQIIRNFDWPKEIEYNTFIKITTNYE